MKVQPLHDRVLVTRIQVEDRSKGGIFIPDTAKEKPLEAQVIAVGSGKRNERGELIPLEVKAGDRVLFGKYSGTDIVIDGEEHLSLREEDILAVVDAAA